MKYIASIAIVCISYLMNTCMHETGYNTRLQMQLDLMTQLRSQHGDVQQPKL